MIEKKFFSWILIGVLVRFIFMPFTMHPDILHIYYHPNFLASKGVWDIYSYHADFFKEHHHHYYAPLTYLFFGFYLYLIRPFLSGFDTFMEHVRMVTDLGNGHSGHYLIEAQTQGLFRFLFLMKLPYLFFDLGLLALILSFTSLPGAMRGTWVKWWAFNPLLIYTCYFLGQFDIIPAFFIVLGAFLAFKGKNVLAMLSLGTGCALKGFPILLIFPFSFYLGKNLKGIVRYSLTGILPLLIIVGPYYLLSSGNVIGTFFSERISHRLGFTDTWGMVRLSIFIIGYIILCLSLLKRPVRERMGEFWPVKVSFLTLALLFITCPISFHYFLWITPFVLILGCNFRIINFYLFAVLSLGIAVVAGKGMWMGLFSPIYPEFFIGLPSLGEIIDRFLPYAFIKRLAYFIFIGTMGWMSAVVLKAKSYDAK